MTPRDMTRVTLDQFVSRDIPVPSVAFRVSTFKRFEVQGLSKDEKHPTGEIGNSRERISCRHDQPASVNCLTYCVTPPTPALEDEGGRETVL